MSPSECTSRTSSHLLRQPDPFQRHAQLSFRRDLKDSDALRIVTQTMAEQQRETMPAQATAPEAAR